MVSILSQLGERLPMLQCKHIPETFIYLGLPDLQVVPHFLFPEEVEVFKRLEEPEEVWDLIYESSWVDFEKKSDGHEIEDIEFVFDADLVEIGKEVHFVADLRVVFEVVEELTRENGPIGTTLELDASGGLCPDHVGEGVTGFHFWRLRWYIEGVKGSC